MGITGGQWVGLFFIAAFFGYMTIVSVSDHIRDIKVAKYTGKDPGKVDSEPAEMPGDKLNLPEARRVAASASERNEKARNDL